MKGNAGSKDVTEQSFDKWKQKEEEFHLEQAILRSKIRIENGREKPIDFLAKVIFIIIGKYDITDPKFLTKEDYKKPYSMFDLMNVLELKDLLKDIEVYSGIDRSNKDFQVYWDACRQLLELAIEKK